MIDKLAELNRVLLAVKDLVDNEGSANVEAVIDHCKSQVIEARMPNHENSIAFAEQIGLLAVHDTALGLTENGVGFLDLNPGSLYDLSDGQKKLLLRICYLHGPLREQSRNTLGEFSQLLGGDALRWSSYDSSPLPSEWPAEHLKPTGLAPASRRRVGGSRRVYKHRCGIFGRGGGLVRGEIQGVSEGEGGGR